MRMKLRVVLVLMLCCLFVARLIRPVQAAGTVTDCSNSAGLNSALAGGGTITFACSGTIHVSQMYITQATTLNATGQTVILDANNSNRHFLVTAPLTLEHITLRNGAPGAAENGGAILSFSTVQINNSTIANNSAYVGGAIFNSNAGVITITNSTISGSIALNAGAIYNIGRLTITNSTLSGNTATRSGGAIYNNASGNLTMTGSTISNNNATVKGGGIFMEGGAVTQVRLSSLTGNTASGNGGALFQEVTGGVTNIECSNITGNGGAGSRVANLAGAALTARANWWGAANGPGGVGPGGGDSVSSIVDFSGFLAAPATAGTCPIAPPPTWTPIFFTPTPITALTSTPVANQASGSDIVVGETVPLCADLDGTTNPVVRVLLPSGIYGVHCRIIAENRVFTRSAAEVGVPSVLDRGVIHAVDIFSPSNASAAGVFVCLQGEGDLIFLDAAGAPRTPQSLSVQPRDGFSCSLIPNVGTVVLVDRPPAS
jgi:hypothetical protein